MKQRLLSLDVFRGMTIFFMILVNTPGSWQYVYPPLLHAPWDGCTPTDLVFPFFMFIVGVSLAISYTKFKGDKSSWIKKAIYRGLKIILLGLLLNWFPFYDKNISDLRYFGVLQRIGLAFIPAAIIISMVNKKNIYYIITVILLGYWGVIYSGGNNAFTLEGNIVGRMDLWLFGESHVYKGYGVPFDPEGLLSTIPAVGTILLGYMAGLIILTEIDLIYKLRKMITVGALLTVLGYVWSLLGFPINKPLWSSSYVLYTGGLAILFLGLLIWIIDVYKVVKWVYIFKAFGQNPLVTFILSGVLVKILLKIKIGSINLYGWLYQSVYQPFLGNYLGSFVFALSIVMLIWCVAYILEKKDILIKV